MFSKPLYFTIGESLRFWLELSLPLYYKRGGRSNHFTIGAEHHDMVIKNKDNLLFTSAYFSSLSDILRSIDTFTMLRGFLKNPFVVTTFICLMLPRFKPSPLNYLKKLIIYYE